jgi:hypothetical protein
VSKYQVLLSSRFRGVRVLECACKDTGAFVGESTLLLDFEMLKQTFDSLDSKCSYQEDLQVAENGTLYIKRTITKCRLRSIYEILVVYI